MAKDKSPNVHAWHTHKFSCEPCQSVNSSSTASLANCCLVGAPLLRDYLVTMSAPKIKARNMTIKRQFEQKDVDGKSYRASKQKLKEVTRYKERL